MAPRTRDDIRNVAIVAHVDHGKTTLVDKMLWQSGAFGEHQHVDERAMDSGDHEREKGITILAKNTAVHYRGKSAAEAGLPGGVTINIIDTPGHADFGGEVERGLSMVDGVVLLVDASEGPLPQTRFVLRKALTARLPVILCVNKVDRPDSRIAEVVEETSELFLDLLEDDTADAADLLDFPVVYASAKTGRASLTQPENGTQPDGTDLEALFATILSTIPAPVYDDEAPLQAHVTNLDSSNFLGRLALLRVYNGTIAKGQTVMWCRHDGSRSPVKITELLMTEALERKPADSAGPGDIIAVAGILDHHRRDPRQPGRPAPPAPHHRRRAGHLDDDRHQHQPDGRPGARVQGHRADGARPPRPRDGRQRLAADPPDRASRHVGGARSRRARPGHPRGADAP